MTTDPSADLVSELAHLRACADAIPVNPGAFDLEVLMPRYARAVAALEAVQALHHRRDNPVKTRHICQAHGPWGDDEGYNAACPDCTITEKHVCDHCRRECLDDDAWPCPTFRAITAALAGDNATTQQPEQR